MRKIALITVIYTDMRNDFYPFKIQPFATKKVTVQYRLINLSRNDIGPITIWAVSKVTFFHRNFQLL